MVSKDRIFQDEIFLAGFGLQLFVTHQELRQSLTPESNCSLSQHLPDLTPTCPSYLGSYLYTYIHAVTENTEGLNL
jgi:hypothetical protein